MVRHIAGGLRINRRNGVSAASRACRPLPGSPTAQVRLQAALGHVGGTGLVVLQRPLLNGAINLPEVVDARIDLRGRAGLDEVGDGDRGQQANNGHDDHDFHQRETRFARGFEFHTSTSLSVCYAA